MRYLLIIILCLIPFTGNTTETIKISELGTADAATSDDYMVIVDNPDGSPVTKKITVENFFGIMASLFSSEGYFYSYITTAETPGEDEQVVCWETTGGLNTVKSCGTKTTDNSTATHLLCKDDSGEIENCTLAGLAISGTDSPTITVESIPANATINAAGEVTVDTTTDQFKYYGGAARVLPYIQYLSFVIPAPAEADDINIMKAPYGMTIIGIDCIVQGTTSATGQIQECSATGGDCADLDSDIVCDADGAADDGSLTDSAIASGAWLRWKTTSLSGTPTFLTVTVRYAVVAD